MDGYNVTQLCDPNDNATGRTTGVVRAAVEEFWNDLKRAHYIDAASRSVVITLQLRSRNLGVASRASCTTSRERFTNRTRCSVTS